METVSRQRFPLGRCLVTPAARDRLAAAGVPEDAILSRHAVGDWGEVCDEDRFLNERAIVTKARILSAYLIAGDMVWVETCAEWSGTTVLMAREWQV